MASTPARLTRYAWLSVAAAVVTIVLKLGAYQLTGSVGLLSDAAESVVNLVAAFVALAALHVAAKPADDEHQFGHAKAEYFSAAVEGVMIFIAAVFILWSAVNRLLDPAELENVGVGLAISIGASAVNGAVALVLLRGARRHSSITLEADGRHLMTDVVTSVGVVAGIVLVVLTGWLRLDPLIAIAVGCNIIWTGWGLVRRSIDALLDRALPPEELEAVQGVLDEFAAGGVEFHHVRTRMAGRQRFISMAVRVPGDWTVSRGHDVCEAVELRLKALSDHTGVDTHLEPIGVVHTVPGRPPDDPA
ncbi:MAG: cation transporter [Thermoleophilia bacterium]|nr:cation transporter [Thermoleophilia bacterium]